MARPLLIKNFASCFALFFAQWMITVPALNGSFVSSFIELNIILVTLIETDIQRLDLHIDFPLISSHDDWDFLMRWCSKMWSSVKTHLLDRRDFFYRLLALHSIWTLVLAKCMDTGQRVHISRMYQNFVKSFLSSLPLRITILVYMWNHLLHFV